MADRTGRLWRASAVLSGLALLSSCASRPRIEEVTARQVESLWKKTYGPQIAALKQEVEELTRRFDEAMGILSMLNSSAVTKRGLDARLREDLEKVDGEIQQRTEGLAQRLGEIESLLARTRQDLDDFNGSTQRQLAEFNVVLENFVDVGDRLRQATDEFRQTVELILAVLYSMRKGSTDVLDRLIQHLEQKVARPLRRPEDQESRGP